MLTDILLMILGLVLVSKGGDLFVESSVRMASALRIPRIIVGGTIVSLATTMPELVVSATASLMKNPGIALGNAVGSAIANIGLILALSAVLAPLAVDVKDFKRRSAWLLFSALLMIILTWRLELGRLSAVFLLAVSLAYLYMDYLAARKSHAGGGSDASGGEDPRLVSMKKTMLVFLAGAVLVIAGSRFLVDSAVSVATALGIPQVVIGLTVVAVGTSLPELVTALAAAKKGVQDLSVGNIVGANILNLAMIVGVSGMIHPLSLTRMTQIYAFSWMMVFVLLAIFFLGRDGRMGRTQGLFMLVLYAVYSAGSVFIR